MGCDRGKEKKKMMMMMMMMMMTVVMEGFARTKVSFFFFSVALLTFFFFAPFFSKQKTSPLQQHQPLTYFSGQAITLLAYAYYLMTRRAAADYSSLEEQLREKFSATAALEQQDFCPERYESLRRDVERYARYARRGGEAKEEGNGGGSRDSDSSSSS